MKKENTATRLKKIMNKRNLRQVDILNLTVPYCKKYDVKMNKSDISQYCSGKTEPNQDKLYVLSLALGVSESWLMGYDVPIDSKFSRKVIDWYNMANAFDHELASLGWTYELKEYDDYTEIDSYYIFTNGKISFNVSTEDYDMFIADSQTFFKNRLQELLEKTMNRMFVEKTSSDKSYLELQAAHERTDIEVTDKMRKHDDDIMDDGNF